MATLETSLSLNDNFSSKLSKIDSAINNTIFSMQNFASSADTNLSFKGVADNIANATDGMANSIINGVKKGVAVGSVALLGLGAAVYNVAGNFDEQMARVNSISDEVGVSFAELREQAIDLGAKTAFSATEAAGGMEAMASAGFNTQQIYDSMSGVLDLAAVSGGDVAMAAENAGAALNGFGLEASQAGHVADVFAMSAAKTNAEVGDMGEAMKYVAPQASAMGISLEETAAAIGVMSDNGIKGLIFCGPVAEKSASNKNRVNSGNPKLFYIDFRMKYAS